jgi:hypothetical protein
MVVIAQCCGDRGGVVPSLAVSVEESAVAARKTQKAEPGVYGFVYSEPGHKPTPAVV